MDENDFGFAIGINFDQKNKRKSKVFDPVYEKVFKEFVGILRKKWEGGEQGGEKEVLDCFVRNLNEFSEHLEK